MNYWVKGGKGQDEGINYIIFRRQKLGKPEAELIVG